MLINVKNIIFNPNQKKIKVYFAPQSQLIAQSFKNASLFSLFGLKLSRYSI